MNEIKNCPSLLLEGYDTYSTKAIKELFDGMVVSHILDFNIDEFRSNSNIIDAMHRISVSGVQEKFPAVIEQGKIRLSHNEERSTYILKPTP